MGADEGKHHALQILHQAHPPVKFPLQLFAIRLNKVNRRLLSKPYLHSSCMRLFGLSQGTLHCTSSPNLAGIQ